jgi:hypothetical protein
VALIKEQGVSFAVVVVRRYVMRGSTGQKDELRTTFSSEFGGVPVVLMSQDGRGIPTYYGRPDLVRWLKNQYVELLPWREFTLAA